MVFLSRRRLLLLSLNCLGVGCGTVLHPERRGQPGGPLDWKIVALDALGLLFFFVPGVIAFAVDFTTGAIYLPPGQYSGPRNDDRPQRLVTARLPEQRVSLADLERVVSQHVQRPIELVPGEYETEPLETIDDFWPVAARLTAGHGWSRRSS